MSCGGYELEVTEDAYMGERSWKLWICFERKFAFEYDSMERLGQNVGTVGMWAHGSTEKNGEGIDTVVNPEISDYCKVMEISRRSPLDPH